nr:MAG TPA: hypothetical protein [Crassvirales sp.]
MAVSLSDISPSSTVAKTLLCCLELFIRKIVAYVFLFSPSPTSYTKILKEYKVGLKNIPFAFTNALVSAFSYS